MNSEVTPQFHQTVSTLIEALIKPDCLKRDLFLALLLLVMKENDFVLLKGIDGGSITIADYIISKRSRKGEAAFILNGFQHMPLKLITCPLNDTILIIVTVPELCKATYSLCVKLSRYINTSTLGIPSDFTNLKELLTDFKDKIVNPVKGTILNYHKFPSANLFGLPDDIIHQILLSLPIGDALNLSGSCKRLHRIVKEDSLWFRFYNRDFADQHKSEGECWRSVYIDAYTLKQQEKLELRGAVESSFEEFPDLPNYTRHVSETRWEVIL